MSKLNTTRYLAAGFCAATATLVAVPAQAFVLQSDSPCSAAITADVTDYGTGVADACYGPYTGNNVPKDTLEFEGDSWSLIGSTEEPIGNLSTTTGETAGTWEYTGTVDPTWDSYWLVIKQSTEYAAWNFDIGSGTAFAGTWSAAWAPGDTGEFSHMELYAGGDGGNGAEVPEPGTALLLGLGLLGLSYARNKR